MKLDVPITAIVYAERQPIGPALAALADALRAEGKALAGFVQHEVPRPGRRKCDMVLEDLATGARIRISEDRGEHARGCRLDTSELLRAAGLAADALAEGADVLVLNKYGKVEAEGGGVRPLIADAVARGVPVIVGVPRLNLESFRAFAGALAVETPLIAPEPAPA
nr:DUF2478 domain-containing protein [Alsobacter ponti]